MIVLEAHECLDLLESNLNYVICLVNDLPIRLQDYDKKEDTLAHLFRQKDYINELRASNDD